MRIFITGVCGFVGSVIARQLLAHKGSLEIVGMDNFIRPGSETNRDILKALGVRLIHGDIRCFSDFEALPKVDYVIDAAANPSVLAGVDGQTSSRQLVEHNLAGTIHLLELCKRDGAGLVLLSTSRVYSISELSKVQVGVKNDAYYPLLEKPIPGLSQEGVHESFSTAAPISLYGSTKLSSEVLALEYGLTFDFPVWINRCGVLAGAGQFGRPDQGIFSYWLHSWFAKKPLRYIGFNGLGYQVRDCLHPRDMVSLLIQQMEYSGKDKKYIQNVSGGVNSSMSLCQLSQWCETKWGKRSVDVDAQPRSFDIPWMVLDSTLANEQWGWRPETPVEAILDEIAEHAFENPHWLNLSAAL